MVRYPSCLYLDSTAQLWHAEQTERTTQNVGTSISRLHFQQLLCASNDLLVAKPVSLFVAGTLSSRKSKHDEMNVSLAPDSGVFYWCDYNVRVGTSYHLITEGLLKRFIDVVSGLSL